MRMSAIHPDGFTLIEVIVVLVLLGMISALALPNMLTLYQSVAARTQVDQFRADFNRLGELAAEAGAGFELRSDVGRLNLADFEYPLTLQEDWVVELRQPITFLANGACLGGHLRIFVNDEVLLDQRLEAPRCWLHGD